MLIISILRALSLLHDSTVGNSNIKNFVLNCNVCVFAEQSTMSRRQLKTLALVGDEWSASLLSRFIPRVWTVVPTGSSSEPVRRTDNQPSWSCWQSNPFFIIIHFVTNSLYRLSSHGQCVLYGLRAISNTSTSPCWLTVVLRWYSLVMTGSGKPVCLDEAPPNCHFSTNPVWITLELNPSLYNGKKAINMRSMTRRDKVLIDF